MEELDAKIGMTEDPEQVALADLRQYQEEMGMTFDRPDAPVAPTPGHGPDEEIR